MESKAITEEKLEELKKEYPVGARIELAFMDDEHPVDKGMRGTVRCIDDIGTIHIDWDSGSTLGLVPDVDQWKKVEEE